MEQGEEFKHGSDLQDSADAVRTEILSCESCGRHTEKDAARDLGWQVRPPVCPDCLHWSLTIQAEAKASELRIEPRGRYWALYEDGLLVCITVYRKGAAAVAARISRDAPGNGHGKA